MSTYEPLREYGRVTCANCHNPPDWHADDTRACPPPDPEGWGWAHDPSPWR